MAALSQPVADLAARGGGADDLVTADLSDLAPGRGCHALFLAPTGGVRASFTVTLPGDGLLLVQDPTQPRAIDELLAPYVLSSDVAVEDRSARGVFVVEVPHLAKLQEVMHAIRRVSGVTRVDRRQRFVRQAPPPPRRASGEE